MGGLVEQTGFFLEIRQMTELDLLRTTCNGWQYRSRGISSEPFGPAYRKLLPRVQEGPRLMTACRYSKDIDSASLHNLSDEQTEYQARDRLYARIGGLIREEAANVLAGMGLSVSGDIRMLLTCIAADKVLPLDINRAQPQLGTKKP